MDKKPSDTPPSYCRALFGISGNEGEGLFIEIGKEVTGLTLSFSGEGFLNFSNLELRHPDGTGFAAELVAEVSCSQPHASMGKWNWQEDPYAAKGYHSEHRWKPFYTIRFTNPVALGSIIVRNRLARWGVRLLPLQVTATNQEETVFFWKNLSAARLAYSAINIRKLIEEYRTKNQLESADGALSALDRFLSLPFEHISEGAPEAVTAFRELRTAVRTAALEFGERKIFKSWRFLELVIDRYPDSTSRSENLEPLAVYFALRLHDGSIGKGFADLLASWNGYFANAAELEELEQLVAVQYSNLGGQGRPVITRHGWFVSKLSRYRNEVLKSMVQLVNQLPGHEGRIFVVYGTLLGAVRDKDFIAYDDDADLALEVPVLDENQLEPIMEKIRAAAVAMGFKAGYSKEFKIVQIATREAPEVGIDIFACIPESGALEGLYRMQHRSMQWRYISKEILFPLTTIDLLGEKLPAPRLPEIFLQWRYGDTWKTPLKFFEMDWIFSR